MQVMFWLVSSAGAITGRKTAIIDKLAFGEYLEWLALGYRTYQSRVS
jgi:hypothetical protein